MPGTQPLFSYDADDYVRQMREAYARSLEVARATITDPKALAGFEAQATCLPARECFARVHIGLREAGHGDAFIAAVAGALAGSILQEGLMNSASPQDFWNVFCNNLRRAGSDEHYVAPSTIGITGQPAGRA